MRENICIEKSDFNLFLERLSTIQGCIFRKNTKSIRCGGQISKVEQKKERMKLYHKTGFSCLWITRYFWWVLGLRDD